VVALQGEAGAGKTRLMQELAVYASAKSAIVLSGSASEETLPYAPWVEITRQYVAQAPGELLRRMIGPNTSELVKLVPDIAAKLGTIPPSKSLGEVQDKMRFYEAVTQFFIAICKDTPLVLLFDDMKFVDQSSLDLLDYFVRSASSLRALTVCSVPAEHELESGNPLEQALLKFNKQRVLEVVTVKNLNKEDTIGLIKQVFGEQTISSEFADLIYRRTAGNPFFVEEILRSLVEDGIIFRTPKGWDRKPIQEIAIPRSVKTTLRSRLGKFDQEAVSVLSIAAVIGSEFDFQVLREATQSQEDALLDRIEEAISSGLILEDKRRKGTLRFADNRIRELFLDDLSELRKTSHHLKIAEAIEKYYAKDLESQAEPIAVHSSEGGDAQRTFKYSIMAGERNVSVYAYEEAIQDFKRDVDAFDGLEREGKDGERATVLEKLARTYDLAGHAQESAQCYEQALALFEKLHDFKACTRISVGLSKSLFRSKPTGTQDAVLVLKRNLKYLETDPESFEAAAFYSELATRLIGMDQFDEMNTWVEKALVAGEKSKNFEAVSVALWIKATFMLEKSSQIDEGLHLLERSYQLALEHEIYELAGNNLLNLSGYMYLRDLTKARELVLQARESELGDRTVRVIPRSEAAACVLLAALDWLRGDWKTAFDEVNNAIEIANRLGFTNDYILSGEVFRALFYLCMGDLEEAKECFESSSAKQRTEVVFNVWFNLSLGKLRLEEGREDDAKACFERCVNAFKDRELSDPWPNVETLMHLTSIYAGREQLKEARKTSEWANRLAGSQWRSDALVAMALQAEASVLVACGNTKVAEETYLKCLASWEKAGWPYYQGKALVACSEAIAQYNPEESTKRLMQAVEIFRKLGAKRDLQKAESRLQS